LVLGFRHVPDLKVCIIVQRYPVIINPVRKLFDYNLRLILAGNYSKFFSNGVNPGR